MTVRFRSTFEEERVVPWLGDLIVEPGGVINVPDEEWESWKAGGWKPLDPDPATKPPTLLPASPTAGSNAPAPTVAPAPAAPAAPPATPAPAQPTTDAKG